VNRPAGALIGIETPAWRRAGTGALALLAGLTLIRSPLKLLGLDIGKLWKLFPASVARLAGDLCARLGSSRQFGLQEVPLIENRYCGPGYARHWDRCQAAMETIAVQEGLLLDPIYTGKAFTGILDLIEKGEIRSGEAVIFLHTGGLPALFAYDHGSQFCRTHGYSHASLKRQRGTARQSRLKDAVAPRYPLPHPNL
jgi:1-aminocyclopropane-1-carboxylate deaminase/D-cysteine desulfhydrase-like pyridoxal-dependent ACC family enzyme